MIYPSCTLSFHHASGIGLMVYIMSKGSIFKVLKNNFE